MKIIFRNPCKKCIVQAVCTNECDLKLHYLGTLLKPWKTLALVFLLPLSSISFVRIKTGSSFILEMLILGISFLFILAVYMILSMRLLDE